jgi:hypothetical protein
MLTVMLAEIADIDPGEDNLLDIGPGDLPGDLHGVFNGFAAASATHVWNAAEGAKIVASILNLEK